MNSIHLQVHCCNLSWNFNTSIWQVLGKRLYRIWIFKWPYWRQQNSLPWASNKFSIHNEDMQHAQISASHVRPNKTYVVLQFLVWIWFTSLLALCNFIPGQFYAVLMFVYPPSEPFKGIAFQAYSMYNIWVEYACTCNANGSEGG